MYHILITQKNDQKLLAIAIFTNLSVKWQPRYYRLVSIV